MVKLFFVSHQLKNLEINQQFHKCILFLKSPSKYQEDQNLCLTSLKTSLPEFNIPISDSLFYHFDCFPHLKSLLPDKCNSENDLENKIGLSHSVLGKLAKYV